MPAFGQIIEPARFVADPEARPIAEASSVAVDGAPLRWKSKPQSVAQAQFSTDAPQPISAEEPARVGWNVTRVDLSVKPAQFTQPAPASDPFSDPFGDRQTVRSVSGEIELQPTATEAGVEELPAPLPISGPRNASPPRPVERTPSPPAEMFEAAQPAPSIPTPESDAERYAPGRPNVPCNRIYNDRNCCDVDSACNAFRNALLSSSLRHISLDITPRFMPDLTEAEDEAERLKKLNILEIRPWKSRTGELLATGRMANFDNGSLVVVSDEGEEVARIPWHQLGEDELCYVNAWWRLPAECTLGGLRTAERNWIPSTFAWHASALCHKPLYFEDVQLERYGHTTGPYSQPFVSGAHFFLNIAALPYNMAIHPPQECIYALGYYRPGNCAPWMIQPVPLSLRGAIAEAGVVVGGVYIIP